MQENDLSVLFCDLADPHSPAPSAQDIRDADVPTLARMASEHNVATILYRKLGAARVAELAPDLAAQTAALTALTLRLEVLLPGMRAAFIEGNLAPIIVKGPVFAARLYPDPSDRPFTDLDIVAQPSEFEAIGKVLRAMGLHQHLKDRFDRSEATQEQKWVSKADPNLLIEVHGDLVHYPGLRRRVRLGHDQLTDLGPEAATTLFLTAVAHGALGHKFHTLRLVVDVLQAFRILDQSERAGLLAKARRARLHLETVQSLHLIAELFGETSAATLLGRKSATGRWPPYLIAGRDVLAAPHARSSKLRRHIFRQVQRYAAR